VENASGLDYHGYHASNFQKVDRRYETHTETEDIGFQEVIDAAHARGMKVILDIVLNHTGNFGEAYLCPEFRRDWTANQANIDDCLIPLTPAEGGKLDPDYSTMASGEQYHERLRHMKNMDNINSDSHNYYHHAGSGWNWDETNRWLGQIAGDCVDLNTENPATAAYLRRCYERFIAMGVDGFRIDTSGHIARISFNHNFIPQFTAAGASHAGDRGAHATPFYMFGEVCSRYSSICYREHDNLSPYYYTWAEQVSHPWDMDTTSFDSYVSYEGDACTSGHTNYVSMAAQATEDYGRMQGPTSQNALLSGNNYHTPDYSQASGLHVIDFTMHHNFETASSAWAIAQPQNDRYYNDATWNVVYVDSHDYAPNGAPENQRYAKGEQAWAENMSLMFTHRGIPCIYYGSEVQFMAGAEIDKGASMPLKQTGRAYFGGYMTGSVSASDFGTYTASGNVAQTLSAPLAKHLIRLNKIRQAVPALRKGQYSTTGCSSSKFAFKRRYTDDDHDSFVLVAISANATFTGIPNGTYVDCITGDEQVVTGGSLTTTGCTTAGNMRIYVLNGPGKIGDDEYYLYGGTRPAKSVPQWDGQQEALTDDPGMPGESGGHSSTEPQDTITPCLGNAEQLCAFFCSTGQAISGNVYAHLWGGTKGTTWPGVKATNLGGGYWKVIVPAECGTPAKIIWSAKGSNQTADLVYTNHGVYAGAVVVDTITLVCDSDDTPEPEPVVPVDPVDPVDPDQPCRIYYAGSLTTPYIWAWDENPTHNYFAAWPGQPMTATGETLGGKPLWYYEFSGVLPEKCIFSNRGSSQTADLTTRGCDYVYTGGAWQTLDTSTGVFTPATSAPTAQKVLINGHLYLVTPNGIYDALGRKQ